jgi:hypothetical protein
MAVLIAVPIFTQASITAATGMSLPSFSWASSTRSLAKAASLILRLSLDVSLSRFVRLGSMFRHKRPLYHGKYFATLFE